MKTTTFNGQNIGLNGPFPCDMLDYQRGYKIYYKPVIIDNWVCGIHIYIFHTL